MIELKLILAFGEASFGLNSIISLPRPVFAPLKGIRSSLRMQNYLPIFMPEFSIFH